jgi:hypothetical protein
MFILCYSKYTREIGIDGRWPKLADVLMAGPARANA